MRVALLYLLFVVLAVSVSADAKKSFSTRRKSGGNSRRGQTYQKQPPPAPVPATPHRTDSGASTTFLNSERAGSSSSGTGGYTNTHYRGSPFDSAKQQHQGQQHVPQTNGPIGFEKVQSQGNQKLGFDRVNSEVQHKSASGNVPSAPAYPGPQSKSSVPNGPPPAYPGYGSPSGTHGGYESPPAYPGRPVNAPPVYSASNPSYPQRNSGYPQQNSPHPQQQWTQPGQQNFGYPNTGSFPNQGYGSYPNTGGFGGYGHQMGGGYGQSYPGYGGNPYGGSPFGQPNSYGGSPFSSGMGGFGNGFGGGNSFGGYGNQYYSPNNFGYSSKPGLFGSLFGGGHSSSHYGYHKRSRFGGLPIPIPIPIPIPFGGFGGFGGRSRNHNVLDTFIKNQTINDSDNSTAVYVLNNSTFTPCTNDQFIYDSLNVTVMSCTAENCTAVKVFTTTNISGKVTTHSAGITMCMERNTTYSSFADNVNPTVSDPQKYWTKVCKELVVTNTTGDFQEGSTSNVTTKFTQTVQEETEIRVVNSTTDESPTQQPIESSTTRTPTETASTAPNLPALQTKTTECETFDCSRIEMCLPTTEIVDHCTTSECPFTRTGYRPCITIKMCKSPTTPISSFATLNNTLSRIDEFNNVTSVNDIANLTLISYIPPALPSNCSENTSDPGCRSLPTTTIDHPQDNVPHDITIPAIASPESTPEGVVLPGVCDPGQHPNPADGSTPSIQCIAPEETVTTNVPSDGEMTNSSSTTVFG